MITSRKNQNQLLSLLSKNKVCFDCTAKSPTCVNMTIGSFVCIQCAGFLREFGHRIKSVTASTFTPEEISDLSNKGNDYAAKSWLAVWIETDDPKPKRDNPKKIKEHMKKKYELKSFYWDPSTSRAQEPVDHPAILDWSASPAVEDKKGSIDVLFAPPPSQKDSFKLTTSMPVHNIKNTVKPEMDTWADFASAFPGSSKSSPTKKMDSTLIQEKQEILLIPANNMIQQDVQLDPFESVKSVNSSGKYDAFKDLAGLSLSETEPKFSTSPKKFENKTLDLSKFVEVGSKSKYPWEKQSDLHRKEEKSSFSAFEMNPFAFDDKVSESKNVAQKSSASASKPSVNPLEYNDWSTPNDIATEDEPKDSVDHLQSDWADSEINIMESTPTATTLQDINETSWVDSNPGLESAKSVQSYMDSQWSTNGEIDSSYNFQETSTTTLYESDMKLNEKINEPAKYQLETNITQSYVPYELDSNVWG